MADDGSGAVAVDLLATVDVLVVMVIFSVVVLLITVFELEEALVA